MTANVVNPVGFVEHLQHGLMINFSVGIDFTGSNGDPTQPTSLHYMNPHAPNEYIQAIQAVGTIIQDYDADKLFPHDDPNHKGAVYYVQLIVTDGAITDMAATKDMIVASSHLPISIIIVGVGTADFSKM
eukprot:gene26774-22079_t